MISQSIWPVGLDCGVSVSVYRNVVLVSDDNIRDSISVNVRHVLDSSSSIRVSLPEGPWTRWIGLVVFIDELLSTLWSDDTVDSLYVTFQVKDDFH